MCKSFAGFWWCNLSPNVGSFAVLSRSIPTAPSRSSKTLSMLTRTSSPSQCHKIALSIWVSCANFSFLSFELIFLVQLPVDDHTEDEILGCLQFVNNYRDRYGHGPNFFEGALEEAVKSACSTKSAKDVSHHICPSLSSILFLFFFTAQTSRNLLAPRSKCLIKRVLWTIAEQREHHQAPDGQLHHLRLGFNMREQQKHVSQAISIGSIKLMGFFSGSFHH